MQQRLSTDATMFRETRTILYLHTLQISARKDTQHYTPGYTTMILCEKDIKSSSG
jgi:hypothetical protein